MTEYLVPRNEIVDGHVCVMLGRGVPLTWNCLSVLGADLCVYNSSKFVCVCVSVRLGLNFD